MKAIEYIMEHGKVAVEAKPRSSMWNTKTWHVKNLDGSMFDTVAKTAYGAVKAWAEKKGMTFPDFEKTKYRQEGEDTVIIEG
jgi:hypothetical protein